MAKNLKWVLLAYNSLVWGSAFIFIKKALVGLSYSEVSVYRMFISLIVSLVFFYKIIINSFKNIDVKEFLFIASVGILGTCIPVFLFPFAQQKLDSLVVGVINSFSPVWAVLIAFFLYKEKINKFSLLGTFIGMIGVLIMMIFSGKTIVLNNLYYGVFVLLAGISYSFASNIVSNSLTKTSPLKINVMTRVLISPIIFYAFYYVGAYKINFNPITYKALFFVFILSVLSSVIGIIVHCKLIKIAGVSFALQSVYFATIVSVVLGFLDGEPVTILQFLGIFFILISLYLVNKFRIKPIN